MKPRTVIIAGSFAKLCGMLLGGAIMVVALAQALNGVCCCWLSERNEG